MAGFSVKIDSHIDEVMDATNEQIEAALEAVGHQAVSHAKSIVTAKGRVATGALRNSISHQVEAGEKAVYFGTNIEYAIFNEYGTGIYADGGGRQSPWSYQDSKGNWHRTSGMPPIHFIRDAASENAEEYKAIIEQYLRSG